MTGKLRDWLYDIAVKCHETLNMSIWLKTQTPFAIFGEDGSHLLE